MAAVNTMTFAPCQSPQMQLYQYMCLLVIAQIFPKYTPLEKVKAKP